MSSKLKHMERSHRSHRKFIPQFQQFYSREFYHQQFKRDKTTFAEHIASMFALFHKFGRKGR